MFQSSAAVFLGQCMLLSTPVMSFFFKTFQIPSPFLHWIWIFTFSVLLQHCFPIHAYVNQYNPFKQAKQNPQMNKMRCIHIMCFSKEFVYIYVWVKNTLPFICGLFHVHLSIMWYIGICMCISETFLMLTCADQSMNVCFSNMCAAANEIAR